MECSVLQPLLRACIISDDPEFRQKVLEKLPGLVGPLDHGALRVLISFSIAEERTKQGLVVLHVSLKP